MRVPEAWGGIIPASLTMFDAHGRLDDAAQTAHLERLVDEGAEGVVVAGTSGEFISLDESERLRLVDLAVRAVGDRIPVIAGTGTASTASTIALTREAGARGAAGAIVILPYFQRPSPREVVEHLRAVGHASPIPVMVYNNPANSGAPALRSEALAALYTEGAARAVKSTFPTVHEVHELRARTDDGFRVLYGSFMAPLEAMAGGAHGWISGILNVVMPDAVALWSAMQAGDLAAARRAWERILPIRSLHGDVSLGAASDLAIYRAILRLRGQPAGYCRRPLLEVDRRGMRRVRALAAATT